MQITRTVAPGQRGAQSLLDQYGSKLFRTMNSSPYASKSRKFT